MDNPFTLHCISWQSGAPLLLETRMAASEIGLLKMEEALPDAQDESSCHALVLSKEGRAIGSARLTPEGIIARVVVLPHERRVQIEAAMIEALNSFARENKQAKIAVFKSKPERGNHRPAA